MKKIIFITRESADMPAVRIRCYGFAGYLQKAGFLAEIFSYADDLGAKTGKEEHFLRVRDKVRLNIMAFTRLVREEEAIIFLQRFNYHSFAPLLIKFLKKTPLIFDLDDWEAREKTKYYLGDIPNSKAELGMRIVAKHSRLCIGASKFLVDFLSGYNENVSYIPTGVDTGVFVPQGNGLPKNKIILSWLGTMHRLDNVENIKFLVKCFEQVSQSRDNVRLEITGDGLYKEQVRKIVELSNNKHIVLNSWIKPGNIPQYMQKVDIGVMPLIQNTKFNKAKSPTRLFEYMAMGKPVVVSNIGECSNIIKNNHNGIVTDSKDDFITGMKRLIENRILCKTIGSNARKTVEKEYSWEILGKRLVEAINKINL
ncbi:MAG: glycosyltransferase [Candidatus Omnitrophota bacterium]